MPNEITVPPVVIEGPTGATGPSLAPPPSPEPMVLGAGKGVPSPGPTANDQPALLAAIPAGKTPVIDRTGSVVLVDNADLAQARQEGMRAATPAEIRNQQAQDIYGSDISGKLATGALNAFDAISLNFGKGLIVEGARAIGGEEAADRMRRGIEASDEANPISRMAGTGLGIVAPLLTGAGALTPIRLAESGASALTKAIPSALAQTTLRAGMEASLFGAGDAFSEAELGGTDITAEKMFAGAGKGFLFGAGLGAGLGVAGKVVGKMTDALPSATARGLAERLADSAASLDAGTVRRLEEMGIDVTKRGSFMLDEPEIRAAMAGGKRLPELHAAAKQALERTGEEIGTALEGIQAGAEKLGKNPDVRSMLRRANEEIVAPLDRVPGLEGPTKKVQEYLQNYGLKTGVFTRAADGSIIETGSAGNATFRQVHDFRQALDGILFDENGGIHGGSKVAKDISRTMRNMQESLFREQAAGVAPEALSAYTSAAGRYHVAEKMTHGMSKSTARFEAKSGLGLLETITGAAGYAAMGPQGALASIAMKLVRERGPQFAAHVLDRAGRLSVYKQAIVDVDTQLSQAAKSMAAPGATTKPSTVTLPYIRRAKKEAEAVKLMAGQPEAIQAAAGKHIDHDVAPNLRAKYLDLAVRSSWYLMAHMPRGADNRPGLPGIRMGEASPTEWAAWGRRVDTVKDPIGAMRAAVQKGQLTQEHIETLDSLFPGLGKEFRQAVILQVANQEAKGKGKGKGGPSYTRRVHLSLLLGVPLDGTMTPSFIESQQKIAAKPSAEMESLYDNPQTMGTSAQGPRKSRGRGQRAFFGGGEGFLDKER